MSVIDTIEQGAGRDTTGEVRPMTMGSHIILRKWHTRNNKFDECSLRELWENGFANGQVFQADNLHLWDKKYSDGNSLYMTSAFFDEVWKAFWSDLSDVEVILPPTNKETTHNEETQEP